MKICFHFVNLLVAALTLFGFTEFPAFAQSFQNLGFESANVPTTPSNGFGDLVPFTDAFPGWTGLKGDQQISFSYDNNMSAGATIVDILGPNWDASKGVIDGSFTALLQVGTTPNGFEGASLSQVGTVPTDARSIFFEASGTDFSLTLGGADIPLVQIAQGVNYTLYGGDISGLAGSAAELRFDALSTPTDRFHDVYVDRFEFSTQIIPEPSTFALFVAGAAVLGFNFKSRHRR